MRGDIAAAEERKSTLRMIDQPENPNERPVRDDTPDASPAPTTHTPLPAPRPFLGRLPTALAAVVLILGFTWWGFGAPSNGQLRQTPTPVAIATIETPTPRPPTATPMPQPTATATLALDLAALLPTVTPTSPPPEVPTRTVEIGGQVTLRLELGNPAFRASGQPLNIALEPRSFVLGGDVNRREERWCVALGASGLVFDLTLHLNPVSEMLSLNGEMQLYDGFCHDLGPLRASAPLVVDIPVEASARLVQSLNAESSLLDLSDLLRTSTGVYAEITIRNPGPGR